MSTLSSVASTSLTSTSSVISRSGAFDRCGITCLSPSSPIVGEERALLYAKRNSLSPRCDSSSSPVCRGRKRKSDSHPVIPDGFLPSKFSWIIIFVLIRIERQYQLSKRNEIERKRIIIENRRLEAEIHALETLKSVKVVAIGRMTRSESAPSLRKCC